MTPGILITGGAGSLGKEFVRLLHKDKRLTVVDNSEWACAELRQEFPDVEIVLADFNGDDYNKAFNYVIHCAAYKHVDLAEDNVSAIIANNLTATAEFYRELLCNKVLYISTDKAVEPISVYGASKMIIERLTWSMGGSVARCGNFLGSSGSVIPVWEKAIREGKPIPVTDEKMVRFVSDPKKAVKEIWTDFLAGKTLIIPSTREVRLMDLLTEVLRKHKFMNPGAYVPGVRVIGVRPGEKLVEKLRWDYE
ncbi:MAG: polysaccharide biosynthesis protein [Nitrospiria bacterium]